MTMRHLTLLVVLTTVALPGCDAVDVDQYLAAIQAYVGADDEHHALLQAELIEVQADAAELEEVLSADGARDGHGFSEPLRCAELGRRVAELQALVDVITPDAENPSATGFVDGERVSDRYEEKERLSAYETARAQYTHCVADFYLPLVDAPDPEESSHDLPIVVDLGKSSKKRIKRLRKGRPALTEEVDAAIAAYMASLEADDPADHAVLVVVYERKKRKSRDAHSSWLQRGELQPEPLTDVSFGSWDVESDRVVHMICPAGTVEAPGGARRAMFRCVVQVGSGWGDKLTKSVVRFSVPVPDGEEVDVGSAQVRSEDPFFFPAPEGISLDTAAAVVDGELVVDLAGSGLAAAFIDCPACEGVGSVSAPLPAP